MFAACSTLIRSFCATIFVPGGAMVVALKPNVPKISPYTDNLGFVLDFCNKCFVDFSFLHYTTPQINRIFGLLTQTLPYMVLDVRIARYTAFLLWIYGGDIFTTVFIFVTIILTLLMLHCPLCSILVHVSHFLMGHIRHQMH